MANTGIEAQILTPPHEPAWRAYVDSHPDATIYHTLDWRDILHDEYGFAPVYFMAKEGDKVVGVLPMFLVKNLRGKRLASLPFSIYGGPVGTDEAISRLLSRGIGMVREGMAGSLEIRSCRPLTAQAAVVEAADLISTSVDLTAGVDALWKGLTDRNDVSRALREGLGFVLSDGEGIEKFYRLQLLTRKRLGLPTPSLRYYRSFFGKMRGMVKLALVEKGGTPVAGGVFFAYRGRILYSLGASDQAYLHLRPNDLLIWEMIKWSASAGYRDFDLGPTPPVDNGLLHFKRKWGGTETALKRYRYPSSTGKGTLSGGSSLFRLMPLTAAKLLGPRVIRCLG